MINGQVGGWRLFVSMTVKAIDYALVGVGNDHGYRDPGL